MTPAPRFLVHVWFRLCLARFRRRLNRQGRGIAAQEKTFARLMAAAASTDFGRTHRLTARTTYAQFRAAVPPAAPESFAPLIARLVRGETDVLFPGPCRLFVETAGTTAGGTPKLLPAPVAFLDHFHLSLRAAAFLHALRAGHAGLFLGRHLHAGASTAVRAQSDHYRTGLDGLLRLVPGPWAESHLLAPPPTIAQLPAGPQKNTAIAGSMRDQDVTLLAGTPADVCALAQTIRDQTGNPQTRLPHLQVLWPNLEGLCYYGSALGLHADSLRDLLGPSVRFHEIYLAAEGVIAAQDHLQPAALRLLTDTGLFFEFLPVADYRADTLATAGERCLPLADVQPGVDYVLLLTTPAGLCRYVLGDIVRFLSVDPPRLHVVGRLDSQLDLCGEQVSERELTDSLLAVCRQNGWQPLHFHVAPYRQRVAAGQTVLCHEWWLELRPQTVRTPTALVIGPGLDAELRARNPAYAAKRAAGKLAEPCVRLVIPGVFARHAAHHQPEHATGKLPACRNDRQIADQLSALAGFHAASDPTFTPGRGQSV